MTAATVSKWRTCPVCLGQGDADGAMIHDATNVAHIVRCIRCEGTGQVEYRVPVETPAPEREPR